MKRIILLIVFIFCKNISFSQTYSKMFDLYGGWESANELLYYDSTSKSLIFSGTFKNFGVNDSTKYRHAVIWRVDSNGVSNIKSLYASPPDELIGFLPFYTKHSIILKSEVQKLNAETNTLVYMNQVGDTINSFKVEYPEQFNSACYIMKNNLIYSFGTDINAFNYPLAILCFDTLGKQLLFKVYPGKRALTSNVATYENKFLIGGGIYKGNNNDSLVGWYGCMDTSGNFIWDIILPYNSEFPGGSPIIVNKSIYWLGSVPGGNKYKDKKAYAYLFKTDSFGNIIYSKKVLEGTTSKQYFTWCDLSYMVSKHNYIYAAGVVTDTFSSIAYNDYIQFCKIDTLGNIKWRRLFKQWYKDNRAFSLTAIPEGFIICADGKDTTHTTGFTDAWIIKTDTNGCIIPGCHISDGVVEVLDASNYVKVFPNPANTEISILFDDPNKTKIDWVELIDSQGQILQTFLGNDNYCNFSTSNFPNGIYYLAAYFNGMQRIVKKILVQHE
jgi:hypothetical protein